MRRAEQPLEQPLGVVAAAEQHVGVGQPEAAGEERALARRQAVAARSGVVAQHEAVDDQLALDRRDGAAMRGSSGGGSRPSASSSRLASSSLAAVGLHEAVALRVEAVRADVGVDLVAHVRASARRSPGRPNISALLMRAIERDPGHHLRIGEVLRRGRAPPRCRRPARARSSPDARAARICTPSRIRSPARPPRRRLMQRVHHLAEHVELQLAVRRVADAHRLRVLVAGQPAAPPIRSAAARRRCRT